MHNRDISNIDPWFTYTQDRKKQKNKAPKDKAMQRRLEQAKFENRFIGKAPGMFHLVWRPNQQNSFGKLYIYQIPDNKMHKKTKLYSISHGQATNSVPFLTVKTTAFPQKILHIKKHKHVTWETSYRNQLYMH